MHRTLLAQSMRAAGLAALSAAAFAPAAHAVPTDSFLLKTLAPGTQDGIRSDPRVIDAGPLTFFAATDGVHGTVPWAIGASGVSAIDVSAGKGQGESTGEARDAVTVGSTTYFTAPSAGGTRLFSTRGTTATTEPVAGAPDNAGSLKAVGGDLYLTGTPYSKPFRLAAGSTVFEALAPQDEDPNVATFGLESTAEHVVTAVYTYAAGKYSVVVDPGPDRRTLKLDGVAVQPTGNILTPVGGRIFFTARVGGVARALVTDGTDAGTHEVTLPGGERFSWSGRFTPTATTAGKAVFFRAGKVYEIDGATTTLVGTAPAGATFGSAAFVGGRLLFTSVDEDADDGLWAHPLSGPTSTPTKLHGQYIESLVASGSVVYARTVAAPDQGSIILRSDGTVGGTTALTTPDQFANLSSPVARAGGGVYFAGRTEENGRELFELGGSASATPKLVVDANTRPRDADVSREPGSQVSVGDKTLFTVRNSGETPWITDGTRAGTHPLAPSKQLGRPVSAKPFGDRAVLQVGYNWGALWVTDGTDGGTKPIVPGGDKPEPGDSAQSFAVVGDSIYYTSYGATPGNDGNTLRAIWKTDAAGNRTQVPLPGVPANIDVEEIVSVGTDVYFTFRNGDFAYGTEGFWGGLWRLDAKTGDVLQVSDTTAQLSVYAGVGGSGRLYVTGYPSTGGTLLLTSDGTVAGTKDLGVEPDGTPGNTQPPTLWSDGSTVFAFTFGPDGRHLTRVVGETTDRIENSSDVAARDIYNPVIIGDTLYAADGPKLVKVGPTGPAQVVRDFGSYGNPDTADDDRGYIGSLADVNGKLHLQGWSEDHGAEPWISDGTAAGTEELDDVAPGESGSDPSSFMAAGTRTAFLAYTDATGSQLFATGADPVPTPSPVPTPTPATSTPAPLPTTAPVVEEPKAATPVVPAPAPTAIPAPGPVATPAPAPAVPDTRAVPTKVGAKIADVTETKKSYVIDVAGDVLGAKGKRTRAECRGNVEILITATTKKGKGKTAKTIVKELETVKTKLRWIKGECTFEKTITFSKKSVPVGAKVEATVLYRGSASQQPKTGTPVTIELR